MTPPLQAAQVPVAAKRNLCQMSWQAYKPLVHWMDDSALPPERTTAALAGYDTGTAQAVVHRVCPTQQKPPQGGYHAMVAESAETSRRSYTPCHPSLSLFHATRGRPAGTPNLAAFQGENSQVLQLPPPSSTMVCPVMKVALVHSHTAASAISPAVEMRPRG